MEASISAGTALGKHQKKGGFPYWLLRHDPNIQLRTTDRRYLFYAERFMAKLFEKVRPLLIKYGGPIIMVQVENEYGSYPACDSGYMAYMRDMTRAHLGRDVVLFTTDGCSDEMLKCGRVGGTLTTVDFSAQSEPKAMFEVKRQFQKAGPLMNSEMYTGWLDHWGEPKNRLEAELLGSRIRELLAMNASFNLYMFHGGTNFGFKSGANHDAGFRPQLTSYDYDAPIDEAGDITEKFKAVRDAIAEFFPHRVKGEIPAPKMKMALGKIAMKRVSMEIPILVPFLFILPLHRIYLILNKFVPRA
ncbi:hypothetical protein V5799_004063 [Amblyomma americanum]|uniref:Glycoside hydrolase 35 catalytic domain-containing protein n=1 Tax=Amblyomma americanum TaxID=6943 RepID=A0AAQ4D761_AMBAM